MMNTQTKTIQYLPATLTPPFSWVGHIPFAMKLIHILNPDVLVELGTHTGNSYFAFCESVKTNALVTKCFAVDTWEGDEHSEKYDENVFTSVKVFNDSHYQGFSTLLRKTFDEALADFSDHSIELLHIDGFHSYEAVKHDFETWLPKVSRNGVILFHDITVKERGFGVHKFWQELKETYPFTAEFHHSHGLGVLFMEAPKEPVLASFIKLKSQSLFFYECETSGLQTNFIANLNVLKEKCLDENESELIYLEKEFNSLVHQHNLLFQANSQCESQLFLDNEKLENKSRELDLVLNSRSYKLTKPIRVLARWLRVLKKNAIKFKILTTKVGLKEASKMALKKLLRKPNSQNQEQYYLRWFLKQQRQHIQEAKQIILNHSQQELPMISVIMPVYNSNLDLLSQAIDSVENQIYPNWELCICNDASTQQGIRSFLDQRAERNTKIKIIHAEENSHISIASNLAISISEGKYLALLDHDDLITPDALVWVFEASQKNPKAKVFFSDEDKIDAYGNLKAPYFKPNWNLELAMGQNFVSHLGVYDAQLVKELGGFRTGLEGAQDYDLMLRCAAHLDLSDIVHIPKVLYHWRAIEGSTALSIDEKPYVVEASIKAIENFKTLLGLKGEVVKSEGGYRLKPALPLHQPSVTIIIPTYNALNLIKPCIESILNKTTYQNYRILVIDNRSDELETLNYLEQIEQLNDKVVVIHDSQPFNYSAINNAAVKHCDSEFVLLLNNDTEVISPEWLSEMVALGLREKAGAIGAKLIYQDRRVQHGGVVIGLGGVAGHVHHLLDEHEQGYFSQALLTRATSAVTAACLLVKKSIYDEVGGLDEENLTVAFNDIDFCLKVMQAGYRNIWTPNALLYHYESLTRGYEDTPEKQKRFNQEVAYMQKRWRQLIDNDPYYNPNLSFTTPYRVDLDRL